MTAPKKHALVIGSSGLVGSNLIAAMHNAGGWEITGVSRGRSANVDSRISSVAVDLLDEEAVRQKLEGLAPTHVFLCAWTMCESERENIRVNRGIVRNVLDAVGPNRSVRHVALVTGTKHYLGPFELYAKGVPETPFREEQPRLAAPNFYYEQEDAMIGASNKFGFSYSVHRPYTIIGHAIGNLMNMGTTIAVYASICKEMDLPFVFPGSQVAWSGLSEYSDARLIAKHLLWAANEPAARNLAFNIVNGDLFRWSWMWPRLAAFFGISDGPYAGRSTSLAAALSEAAPIWQQMIARHGLQPISLEKLASPWHTDLDLSRPFEIISDMSRSRARGFSDYQETERSFLDLFERLRRERFIP